MWHRNVTGYNPVIYPSMLEPASFRFGYHRKIHTVFRMRVCFCSRFISTSGYVSLATDDAHRRWKQHGRRQGRSNFEKAETSCSFCQSCRHICGKEHQQGNSLEPEVYIPDIFATIGVFLSYVDRSFLLSKFVDFCKFGCRGELWRNRQWVGGQQSNGGRKKRKFLQSSWYNVWCWKKRETIVG